MMKNHRLPLIFTLLFLIIIPGSIVRVHHEAVNVLDEPPRLTVEFDNEPEREHHMSTVLDTPIRITNLEGAFDGYNLFLIGKWNTTNSVIEYYLVVTDMVGESLVEKYIGNNFYGICAEFINSTTVLLGTPDGGALWNFYDDTMVNLNITGHHEYEWNPVNNTFFTLNYYRIDIAGTLYQFDYIEEYNMTGDLIWSMDTHDFISESQWCPYGDMWADARDITHSNTIFYDVEDDVIYYNSRNTNTFYKIDHNTSTVKWGVGEYGDFTLYDIDGYQKDELFYHAHAVEKIDENKFILFDNDYHNQESSSHKVSRMVEIEINTNTMTARETWTWEAPPNYWTIRYGDADRLPNGNRLGAFGTEFHPGSDLSAQLVEVDEGGNIVWEMAFEKPADLQFIIYRAERVRFEPTLLDSDDVYAAIDQDVELSWLALYNFRSKVAVNGSYILYLNGSIHDTGTITYDHLWRPVNLTRNVGILPEGIHEFTLAVSDDIGHFTNDSLNVFVSDFYIERQGPTEIEYGAPGAAITWVGFSNETHTGNITLNGGLVSSFDWNGSEPIVLDLESLAVDSYDVEIRLFQNGSLSYFESFLVDVFAREAPVFISTPGNSIAMWNADTFLIWDLFDYSETDVHLYFNDTLTYSTSWTGFDYQLNWSVPLRDEGVYNVTVVATDSFGLQNVDQLLLTIVSPSPPAIVTWPQDMTLTWGSAGNAFNWEVHGGSSWKVLRNGSEIYQGLIAGTDVSVEIDNWQVEGWRLGTYNVTFVASDDISSSMVTSWITVLYNPGDPYADSVVESRSDWILFGDNALDAPDNEFAVVYLDYSNGILTLDMGMGEEILDGTDVDFKVVATGGTYRASVAPDLEHAFTSLGYGTGNTTFDLSGTGLSSVRYIQLEYFTGDSIEVDAIVAYNFELQSTDTGAPVIEGPPDTEVFQGVSPAVLEWTAEDATPWSYSILVNGIEEFTDPWSGEEIVFSFNPESVGTWNVTIVVEDLFGNSAYDTVIVTANSSSSLLGIVALVSVPAIVLVILVVYYLKKRK
ncbi:MAG: aryl-sulfate sulfotransferase [Candidatus Thorarchaeota archaeon]